MKLVEKHNEETQTLESELNALENYNSEELQTMVAALHIDKRCNICSIVNLCLKHDTDKLWLTDYSLLCYKCNSAPRTTISLLIIASEFLMITQNRFATIKFDNVFADKILTIFDFHSHFYINKCFSTNDEFSLIDESITLNHMNAVKSILLREEIIPNIKLKKSFFKPPSKKPTTTGTEVLEMQTVETHCRFIQLIFYMWSGTPVFCHVPMTNLAIHKTNRLRKIGNERTLDKNQGPILLSTVPISLIKNDTNTVCLACEMMCCSLQDYTLLKNMYDSIINYCKNNVKMIDRTNYMLSELLQRTQIAKKVKKCTDYSHYIKMSTSTDNIELDELSYLILKQIGPIGLYKHFFCDPQCIANFKTTKPDILFYTTAPNNLQDFKVTICHRNEYLNNINKSLWMAIQLFKGLQVSKPNFKNKTQIQEFLRFFIILLDANNFQVLDPSFTITNYV